jgi:predicted nucleic acid-binding protein
MRGVEPVRAWIARYASEVAMSTITLAEIRRGIELKEPGRSRRALEQKFRCLMEDFGGAIWLFDEAAAFEWARLMAEARNDPLSYGDSLIAAIARSMDAKVATRNVKHFPGCRTIDPWTGKETPAWKPS